MIGSSFRCLSRISEARGYYDRGMHAECQGIIDSIRGCSCTCGENEICTTALRIAIRGMPQITRTCNICPA